MTNNTRDWIFIALTYVAAISIMVGLFTWVAVTGEPALPVPTSPAQVGYTLDPAIYGPYTPGNASTAPFNGPPQGISDAQCGGTQAYSLLAPGLEWNTQTMRAAPLALKLNVSKDLAWVDWAKVDNLTTHYYGVHLAMDPKGVQVVFADPANFTLAQMGKSAVPQKAEHPDQYEYGRVDTDGVGYLDNTGHVVHWSMQYRVAIFSSMPHDEAVFVLVHELGHALGLAHIHNPGQVMYGVADHTAGSALGLTDCQRLDLAHLSIKGA